MEMDFRMISFFLNSAKKRFRAASTTKPMITRVRYLVGKMFRRRTLTRSATKDAMEIPARTQVVILKILFGAFSGFGR